ncbi:hypothetical protein ACFL2Q_03375, partial [Thermodesulfobacteriota bacterium]
MEQATAVVLQRLPNKKRYFVKDSKLFHLVGLGCPKNRVDSERIIAAMVHGGFSHVEDPRHAGTIIINTCAFIQPAVEESIDVIFDHRALNDEAKLVVMGCLPLRYEGTLSDLMPEVDLFVEPER